MSSQEQQQHPPPPHYPATGPPPGGNSRWGPRVPGQGSSDPRQKPQYAANNQSSSTEWNAASGVAPPGMGHAAPPPPTINIPPPQQGQWNTNGPPPPHHPNTNYNTTAPHGSFVGGGRSPRPDGQRSPFGAGGVSPRFMDPRNKKRSSPSPSSLDPLSTAPAGGNGSSSTTATMTKPLGLGDAVPEELYTQNYRVIDEVEWGPREEDDGYDSDQTLAPRPKNKVTADVCTCHEPKPGKTHTCRDDDCINYACREECRKNHCVEMCGNQRISRRQFKPIQVFDAGPKGFGLRVLEDCVKGDIIQEYTGQAVRAEALTKLFRRYQHERRLYIMALDTETYLDAKKAGGLARYINHSCDPNCKVEKWRVKGVYRAAVEALQDIPAGTELTFDYQWTRKAGRAPTKCYCGALNCRGTLEISKSLEEAQMEQLVSGNWVQPRHRRADERIVNRTIRIKMPSESKPKGDSNQGDGSSPDPVVYVVGEITEYNANQKLHRVLYQNLEEKWEDLNAGLDWMILDEDNSPSKGTAIARKAPTQGVSAAPIRKILTDTPSGSNGGGLLTAFSAADPVLSQHLFYLYIQTPVKEAIFSAENDMKGRVERNCQVKISIQQQSRPPLPCNTNDPEDVAKYQALDQSMDGTVWKIAISGKDVAKAHKFLSKSIGYWQKKTTEDLQLPQGNRSPIPGATPLAGVGAAGTGDPNKWVDEVIFPRSIADHVKRKLPSLRERCRNVTINVKPSDSKSKQIARLLLEGTMLPDMHTTRAHFRNIILTICNQELLPNDPLPMISLNRIGVATEKLPRDFGFLGGSLTKDQFESLLRNGSKLLSGQANKSNATSDPTIAMIRSKQKDSSFASSDLNQSPFFTTFETLYGPVWVQSEDDMGRIDSNHRLVGDARSTDQRKVYFGCDPKDLNTQWDIILKRAEEVVRGVRFLFLGADQIYVQFMAQGKLFDYVEKTTGATVSLDTTTGNHIRIDGKSMNTTATNNLPERAKGMSEVKRADLAEELVRLQIEIFRDHFTRQQNWIFGRDWTTITLSNEEAVPDHLKQVATSFGQLDSRSAPHSCMEMSEVVAHLGLPCSVAAHAGTILYRFVSVVPETQIKARDAVLACIFIANKAQKAMKWRKLEAVLEAGYKSFYPGTQFDAEREEVVKLEERVLDAEQELLNALQYDIFVRDMDTLEQAVSTMQSKSIENIFNFAFGPQVLGAGAELWLKYGVNYIFAASAAVLKADVGEVVKGLDLVPLKVCETLKLIVEFAKYGKPSSDKVPSNSALELDKSRLEKYVPKIDEVCMELTKNGGSLVQTLSTTRQRCLAIALANRHAYVIGSVRQELVRDHIQGHIDGIEAESGCTFYFSPSESIPGTEDIKIEGPWRAVAIADYLLRSTEKGSSLPPAKYTTMGVTASARLQVKTHAGLTDAREICTSGGWDGTMHPVGSKEQAEKQLGGKNCVAGKISVKALRGSGLRWWIPRTSGSSSSGSFNDMLSIRSGAGDKLGALARMACGLEGSSTFPILSSFLEGDREKEDGKSTDGPFMAVSLQRWPTEKVSSKEEKRSKKSRGKTMGIGFSPGALQEMQLLTVLHSLVPSSHGHPNFILPVGIGVPGEEDEEKATTPPTEAGDDPMFSLFKTNQENERAAMKDKGVKNSPHLIFQPSPFVLQRFLSRKRGDTVNVLEAPTVVAAWFHDLISALVHCHSNNIILRTVQADQVIVDHNGIAKVSCLYRASIQGLEERRHPPSILSIVKELKKSGSKRKHEEDDDAVSPFAAPEMLLGCPKHTKESDVWTMGCTLANILLSKPAFTGKDRQSLLTSVYKVVGTPAKANFEDGARFPHYTKPAKKYRRGFESALKHMLKGEFIDEYSKAIDLLGKMLHLDPSKRCTAEEALNHEFLSLHRESVGDDKYRTKYVNEWTSLKTKLVKNSKYSNASSSSLSQQRRALMLATAATGGESNEDNEDGLYDFEL